MQRRLHRPVISQAIHFGRGTVPGASRPALSGFMEETLVLFMPEPIDGPRLPSGRAQTSSRESSGSATKIPSCLNSRYGQHTRGFLREEGRSSLSRASAVVMLALGAVDRQAFAALCRILEEQGRPPSHLEGGYEGPAMVRPVVEDTLFEATFPKRRASSVFVHRVLLRFHCFHRLGSFHGKGDFKHPRGGRHGSSADSLNFFHLLLDA